VADYRVAMSDAAERFRRIAAGFSARADNVTEGGWDNPSPCEGWLARDIVRHMVAWMPGYVPGAHDARIPSVDSDARGAWEALRDALQSAFDADVDEAAAAYVIGDVLIHTWDLARATGQDETLDPDEVRRVLAALTRPDEAVLDNGHFAPSVDVPPDADDQTRLLALTGRRP
jgi:uncharacterized protein (TIGR03086 family)